MRKVKEIKDEITAVIDRLSSLAKELHVSEYLDAGADDSEVTIVMGRKLAAALFSYVSGHESISADEAFEAAACISQGISAGTTKPPVQAMDDPEVDDFGRMKWENMEQ